MYCPSCGHEINGTARFCPWCGAVVPGDATADGEAPARSQSDKGPEQAAQPAAQPATAAQQPAPAGWDPDDVSGVRPGSAPAQRRRRWPVVVLVVVLVVALLAGGAWWLWSSGALSQLPADEATDEVPVVYYGTDVAVAVTASTRVVLYGSSGDDPLEDYDVWLLDGDCAVETHHVDGDSFTAESLGVGEGTYSLVAQDPQTSEVYSVGSVTVVAEASADAETDDASDADAESSDASGSGDALVVYEDEVAFRPAGTDDVSDAGADVDSEDDPSATQLAYLLYYQRVLELQASYGEASVDEDADALEGLCVLLVDLDADGLGELVVAYPSGDEEYAGSYRVEVWRYDDSALALEQVCWMLSPYDLGVSFSVREVGDTMYLVLNGIASASGYENVTLVFAGEDGSILYYSEDIPHEGDGDESTIVQTLYGSELTEEEASAYEELADVVLYSYDAIERYSLAGTFSTGGSTYSPSLTAAASEAATRTIVYGIFGLDVPEDDEAEDGVAEAEGQTAEDATGEEEGAAYSTAAAYAAYYDLLLEYQETYGVAGSTVIEGFYYLTGLCFASLVDFDGDGTDELVLAYYDDELDTKHDICIQVWAYEDGLTLLFEDDEDVYSSGTQSGLCIATVDGSSYLLLGFFDQGDQVTSAFAHGYEDGRFSVEHLYGYGADGTFRIGGEEVSEEEFYARCEELQEDQVFYVLECYGSSAGYDTLAPTLEELDSTLSALSVYAQQ